jgi:hypothetical protein
MANRQEHPFPSDGLPAPDTWEELRRKTIAQRRTDAFLTTDERVQTCPLPASFPMLGATAAMWVLIEASLAERGVVIDRSGLAGSACETYPRAALAAWGHRETGKADLATLLRLFPFVHVSPDWNDALSNDDACDALVRALVSRARQLGHTVAPPANDVEAAVREGWIHVSVLPPPRALGLA